MGQTYTREEIQAAFTRWLAEVQSHWQEATDPISLTETLCNYMDAARDQPEK